MRKLEMRDSLRVFNLLDKKQSHDHKYAGKVIVIDANETPIERPKEARGALIVVKKGYLNSNLSLSVFLSDRLEVSPFTIDLITGWLYL